MLEAGRQRRLLDVVQSRSHEQFGQMALADFANPMGLEKVGETSFRESANSGAAQMGVASSCRRGSRWRATAWARSTS